jgi:hypothetical protein
MRGVRAVQASFRRCYSLEVEMALAALILLAWQVVRIPLEGSVATSLAHARSVLRLEQLIRVEVEHDLVRLASSSGLDGFLDWAYGEIHVPALFAFLAAARLFAPSRYPQLRTIFLLSFGTGGHSRARATSRDTAWNVLEILDPDHSLEKFLQTDRRRCPRWRDADSLLRQ